MQGSLRDIAATTLCFALLMTPVGAFAADTAEVQETVPLVGEAAKAIPQHTGADSGAKLLDEEELANLAARAEAPGREVAGGALSNEHLTYIVIALAAAVIVLIVK